MWEQKIIVSAAWLLSLQMLLKNFEPKGQRKWESIRRDERPGSNKRLAFPFHKYMHSRCYGRGKEEKELPVSVDHQWHSLQEREQQQEVAELTVDFYKWVMW